MPDPTPDTIHHIPLAEIDAAALTRDCEGLDSGALDELKTSIAASGLRMPVELFPLSEPRLPHRYGLLSGLRRLMAYRELFDLTGADRYAAIPAFLRAPGTMAQALTSMVEENKIRPPQPMGARPHHLPRPPPGDLPHHRGGGGETLPRRQLPEARPPARPRASGRGT